MALTFVGERGVYFAIRDAIKITALDGNRTIDCYVERSALNAIGSDLSMDPETMVRAFEKGRLDIELAAMVKYRRSRAPSTTLHVTAEDLRALEPATAA